MNPVVDQFDQILEFARQYRLPLTKKRAILREYLQTRIIQLLYSDKHSSPHCFIGGTALRLLYGLDRFSEDLDFDIVGTSAEGIDKLVENVVHKLHRENSPVELYKNVTQRRNYFELRFPQLLHELKISAHADEKLTIKLDFETFWRGHSKELLLLNRYGILMQVLTIPQDQLLVQKVYAYLHRAQTLPRDLYDIIWLIAHGAHLNRHFMEANKLSPHLWLEARDKFEHERPQLSQLKRKLKPFLTHEDSVNHLDLFPELLEKIKLETI